jgi:hypothetical protein
MLQKMRKKRPRTDNEEQAEKEHQEGAHQFERVNNQTDQAKKVEERHCESQAAGKEEELSARKG